MFSYYTSIILISLLALGVLCILIRENGRISRSDKRLLYLTYLLIAVSALAEWGGVQLNGRAGAPRWMLAFFKCVDYILTPMAGGALVTQMRMQNRWQKAMMAILAANTVFQLISAFTGWMVVIDDQNHYTHGPLYGLYIFAGMAIIAIVVIQFILYGRSYRRQNRWSLYGTMGMVVAGVVIQELLPQGNRTFYIAMTISAALMFIHYSEYSQLATGMDQTHADIALSRLKREAGKWHGEKGQGLHLAAGCALAAKYPGLTTEKLVHEADLKMYQMKAEYYEKGGTDRRRRENGAGSGEAL